VVRGLRKVSAPGHGRAGLVSLGLPAPFEARGFHPWSFVAGWRPGVSLLFAVLILAVNLKPLVGLQRAYAQEDPPLTWSKLLDNKPHVMAFSPNFATDRLALFGNSNKDREHGIWRSTDGGETWAKSSEGIPEKKEIDVYEIVFSPDFANDRTVFASVNKQRVMLKEAPGALFRSTDGGQTWQEIAMSGFPSRGVRPMQDLVSLSLSPDFTRDGTMFAIAATVGIYRSTDRGSTWEQLLAENATEVRVAPSYAEERLVAVATPNSGILFSADGGNTWSPRNSGLEGVRNFKRVAFSADFAQDRTMLAMSSSDGIFITRNAGASWEGIARPPANDPMIVMAATPGFASEGFLAYGLKSGEVFLSEDLGQTWNATDSVGIMGGQIEALFLSPDYAVSRTLYAVSVFKGLFRYYPVEAGSEVALTATAVSVNATATAAAIPTALAREKETREEGLTETGCITYYIPVVVLGIWALRYRSRHRQEEG
jgi:photosystem II stability/assembly factor-like uncharacterized protein